MKKLTKEEFIKDCIEKHGDRYDYSLVDYKGVRNKIIIICKEHGEFLKNAKNQFDGEQHYKPVKRFGGISEFKNTKIRDVV